MTIQIKSGKTPYLCRHFALACSFIVASCFVGSTQAAVVSVSSMLEGQGVVQFDNSAYPPLQTVNQASSIQALTINDSNAATNAAASSIGSASWLNAGQGNVNLYNSLYLGAVPVTTIVSNRGYFEYFFQTDQDSTLIIDYDVAMQASGIAASSFLSDLRYQVSIRGLGNGVNSYNVLSNNSSGQISATLAAGNYTFSFLRSIASSTELPDRNQVVIDMNQTANFDWQVVSTVPVPAAVWLFVSGALGLIGFARRKA